MGMCDGATDTIIWGLLITVVNFIKHPSSLTINFKQMNFMACDIPQKQLNK